MGEAGPAAAAEEEEVLSFDERGRHNLVLSVGHEAVPLDKRQRKIKWRCWVHADGGMSSVVSSVLFRACGRVLIDLMCALCNLCSA